MWQRRAKSGWHFFNQTCQDVWSGRDGIAAVFLLSRAFSLHYGPSQIQAIGMKLHWQHYDPVAWQGPCGMSLFLCVHQAQIRGKEKPSISTMSLQRRRTLHKRLVKQALSRLQCKCWYLAYMGRGGIAQPFLVSARERLLSGCLVLYHVFLWCQTEGETCPISSSRRDGKCWAEICQKQTLAAIRAR